MTEATGSRGGLFGAGGRFKGGTDPIMEKFNESLSFDKRYVYVYVYNNLVVFGLAVMIFNFQNGTSCQFMFAT